MTSNEEELVSLEHYNQKTFFKTASLMANSCKAVAILGGAPQHVSEKAWEYGKHLGLAFQVCSICARVVRLRMHAWHVRRYVAADADAARRLPPRSTWMTSWTSQGAAASWASRRSTT